MPVVVLSKIALFYFWPNVVALKMSNKYDLINESRQKRVLRIWEASFKIVSPNNRWHVGAARNMYGYF